MATTSLWGRTPRQSIERECDRRGRKTVVAGCRALIRGELVDSELLLALGGPPAGRFLDGEKRRDMYWLRVWGLRGLLWAWDDAAVPEVRTAIEDEAWRVREMALKVVSMHLIVDLLPEVAAARDDAVARVRRAADHALAHLTTAGA
ncbi:MAG: hypothetical protein Q8M17_17040 [Actinomycetota bacterium]|nr:hypothetical protein [Actinomycetota bacterium]